MDNLKRGNDDGFTIFQRNRRPRNTQPQTLRERRRTLLGEVASGSVSVEDAMRDLNKTYKPTRRFYHKVTNDNKVSVAGVIQGQSLVLSVDEWYKLGAYLGGNNFKRFIDRNSERLHFRRRPENHGDARNYHGRRRGPQNGRVNTAKQQEPETDKQEHPDKQEVEPQEVEPQEDKQKEECCDVKSDSDHSSESESEATGKVTESVQ
jgi:hypothetical protein